MTNRPADNAANMQTEPGLDRDGWTQADELCRKTLEFCAEQGVSPVPPIYELVFAYFEGSREDVVAGLGDAIARGETQGFQLMDLHDRYLGKSELALAFDTIGASLGHELGSLERIASSGHEGAIRSRSELSRLVAGIHDAHGPKDVSSLAQRMRDIVLQQSRNVMDMKEGLDDTRNRLSRIERELETYVRQANTDFLTGLPNRRALDSKLASLFAKPFDPEACEMVMMIDIDWFKVVNDTHGHDVGDNVLREFSSVLRHECEKVGAYSGRWGGEEFSVVHSGASAEKGMGLAEEIRTRFEGLNWKRMSDGADIGKITVSVGLAIRSSACDPASIVQNADRALYVAKDRGRNQCVSFWDL